MIRFSVLSHGYTNKKVEVNMNEMVWVILFIGVYVLLQAYILPKMGIST